MAFTGMAYTVAACMLKGSMVKASTVTHVPHSCGPIKLWRALLGHHPMRPGGLTAASISRVLAPADRFLCVGHNFIGP